MLPEEFQQMELDLESARSGSEDEILLEGEENRLKEPQVMFLGTESTSPFEYRNCSAIYLFSGTSALLMDCAEGTYGQIVDYCGGDQAKIDAILRKTQVIYISHFHGDHVLGLPRFLEERDRAIGQSSRKEIYVIVP